MNIFHQTPLLNYNTMKVECKAETFVTIDSARDLFNPEIQRLMSDFLILGAGSNTLFTGDYSGTVFQIRIKGMQIINEGDSHVMIRSGAGESWDDLVRFCVSKDLWGIENLGLIPGTAGAAPVQNIGAYGVEIKHSLQEVEVFDTKDLSIRKLNNSECEFGYRNSLFKKAPGRFIIFAILLKLNKIPSPVLSYQALSEKFPDPANLSVFSVYDEVCRIRNTKLPDPSFLPNLGSFFKNPEIPLLKADHLKSKNPGLPFFETANGKVRIPAAWLIEECGWKGRRLGRCGVYDKHALVLVNHDHATGREILQLAEQIKDSVYQKFDVILEMEPGIV